MSNYCMYKVVLIILYELYCNVYFKIHTRGTHVVFEVAVMSTSDWDA